MAEIFGVSGGGLAEVNEKMAVVAAIGKNLPLAQCSGTRLETGQWHSTVEASTGRPRR